MTETEEAAALAANEAAHADKIKEIEAAIAKEKEFRNTLIRSNALRSALLEANCSPKHVKGAAALLADRHALIVKDGRRVIARNKHGEEMPVLAIVTAFLASTEGAPFAASRAGRAPGTFETALRAKLNGAGAS
jgi:hydroxymethylpyrimidine/phosphomethylpyrimidine kinase